MSDPPADGWVEVGPADAFPEGRGTEVRVGARRIAIFRSGDELHALKNICPHQGEPLNLMPVRDQAAVCIGHGWRFDLKTGRCLLGEPGARVACYPVDVRDGRVYVNVERR